MSDRVRSRINVRWLLFLIDRLLGVSWYSCERVLHCLCFKGTSRLRSVSFSLSERQHLSAVSNPLPPCQEQEHHVWSVAFTVQTAEWLRQMARRRRRRKKYLLHIFFNLFITRGQCLLTYRLPAASGIYPSSADTKCEYWMCLVVIAARYIKNQ